MDVVHIIRPVSMNPVTSCLLDATGQRPQKLYRYSQRQWLERSLQLGEFRLRPAIQETHSHDSSMSILPFAKPGRSPGATNNYLMLSLTNAWDETLFDVFSGSDCCLVIHDTEEFGERIHRAAQRALP